MVFLSQHRASERLLQLARDPENRWLGRYSARRLEAEAIRDAMLSVSGRLDANFGGPAGDDLTIARRSLYVAVTRATHRLVLATASKWTPLLDVR